MDFKYKKLSGLTLIEIITTVAIIGILGTIGVRYYTQQKIKSYRTEAVSALTIAAQEQERILSDVSGNTASYSDAGFPYDYVHNPGTPVRYRISIDLTCGANMGSNCYTLTATAIGLQAVDAACTSFTLDHLGRKGYTGDGSSNCWAQ